MADTAEVFYVYPPDMLDGSWDGHSGNRRVVVQMLNLSDGTGESLVKKVDLDNLKTSNGNVPGKTVVEKIEYHTSGMGVRIYWDRAPAKLIAYLPPDASDEFDWTDVGGKVDPCDDDRTGDILFTTAGADAGDTYDVTMYVRLKD